MTNQAFHTDQDTQRYVSGSDRLYLSAQMAFVRQLNRVLALYANSFGNTSRGESRFKLWIADKSWTRLDKGLPGFDRGGVKPSACLGTCLVKGMERVLKWEKEVINERPHDPTWAHFLSLTAFREDKKANSLDATSLYLAEITLEAAREQQWSRLQTFEVLKQVWLEENKAFLVKAFETQATSQYQAPDSMSIVSEWDSNADMQRVKFLFPDYLVGCRWSCSLIQAVNEWSERNREALDIIDEGQKPITLTYQTGGPIKEGLRISYKELAMMHEDAMKIFIRSQFLYMEQLVRGESDCYPFNPFVPNVDWSAEFALHKLPKALE